MKAVDGRLKAVGQKSMRRIDARFCAISRMGLTSRVVARLSVLATAYLVRFPFGRSLQPTALGVLP
jgi:hypothetical protein